MLNGVYQGVAVNLNNYENHRTDTQYEDALISKIFVFQLVNSFAALTYVSFIKHFVSQHLFCTHYIGSLNPNCTGDVATTLSTVFLSGLISRAIVQVLVRKVS